jgi:hypothetical protein
MKAHCFGKICFEASRKNVKSHVPRMSIEQSLKLEKQLKKVSTDVVKP